MWKTIKLKWKQMRCDHNWIIKDQTVFAFPNNHPVNFKEQICTKCGKTITNFYLK